MIGILSYGIGNPNAIVNMLDFAGWESQLVSNPQEMHTFDRIILPGVGNFDACMLEFRSQGFEQEIKSYLSSGRPLLAICVGAQMLGTKSEEGNQLGLGVLPLEVKKFNFDSAIRIPRISWGEVHFNRSTSFSSEMAKLGEQKYYFSHSYYLSPNQQEIVTATSKYGHEYTSVVESKNIIGVQFHPEKSHRYGLALLDKFAVWNT